MRSKMNVFGIKRFQADDGTQYSSVFILEDRTLDEQNQIGSIPLKASSEYGLIEKVKSSGIKLPAECEVDFEIISGGGGKGGLYIHEINKLKSEKTHEPSTTSQKK